VIADWPSRTQAADVAEIVPEVLRAAHAIIAAA